MAEPKHPSPPLFDQTGATPESNINITSEKLFDRQDILQMFHISARTLQHWRSKGILHYHKIRGKIFYRQKDVEDMLQRNKVQKK